uniref:B box-type domain-containing protein n=1 Tax=Electrophorus electricus TaxID=8005 RepID=A0A4W4G7E0_ELEEL
MNLNDFVVFPNKPRSVKLNVRSLRELRRDTAQLDQENKDLESRLRQLRETMSREKEEREPAERVVHPLPGAAGSRRRFQLRGKPCGQCEARSAGLMCAECGEDYCVGCFAKFHQKGALKHHRMIPQKAELHTSISSLDVLARFRSQTAQQRGWSVQSPHHTAADSNAMEADPRWGAAAGHFSPMADRHAQNALFLNEGKEMEDEHNEGSLLRGHFDEEESSRSFQLALAEWRERRQVEAMGTQAEGRSQQPIHIEFREHGLSYMERLLLKQHRR